MNTEQVERMGRGKGFVAALDQSGGSTPRALLQYGLPEGSFANEQEMYDLVHAMRTRIMTSPAFTGERILGVILFADTMRRAVEGEATPDYLWKRKRIVPFLKIDRGLADPGDGVQLMKPMPDLDTLLREAVTRNVFGTKMRSVIHEDNADGIRAVVDQQFAVARQVLAAGLVPIVEPEVSIASPEKRRCELRLRAELERAIAGLGKGVKIMLKLSIPTEDNLYACLMESPGVLRVVALSGGYSRDEADRLLARNKGMIASFSRALLEGLSAGQSEEQFNQVLDASIREIYSASVEKNG